MNVKELIAQLQTMDEDAEVYYGYNYGDRTRTTVAKEVTNVQGEIPVRHSEYHRMDKMVEDSEDDRDDDKRVVMLQ